MTQATNEKVPIPTLERLAAYLRLLIDLEQAHVDTVSSAEVERQTGINAAQFRKDLSFFYKSLGEFGKPGVGYNVQDLQTRITRILQIDREQRVILVGAGNLGSALVGYPGLQEHRFNIVAVFDNNYGKIGRPLWNIEIMDVQRLKEVNSVLGARIAILAVPAQTAQKVADLMIDAGIHAILNFAPVLLRHPDTVFVRNVSFLQELAVLSYHLSTDIISLDTTKDLPPQSVKSEGVPLSSTHPDAGDVDAKEAAEAGKNGHRTAHYATASNTPSSTENGLQSDALQSEGLPAEGLPSADPRAEPTALSLSPADVDKPSPEEP